jgi:hypothetical protein
MRARAERARRAGSIPASARVFSGAWIASEACAFFASAQETSGKASTWRSRAWR